MQDTIIGAIEKRYFLQFFYDGGIRVVEPYCYGLTTKGNKGLRAFQVSGYSSSGKMGWKMFDMSKASSIVVLDDVFIKTRIDYKRGDRGMKTIFCEI